MLENDIWTNIKNKLNVKTSVDGDFSSQNDNICEECVICFEEKEFVTIVPCLHRETIGNINKEVSHSVLIELAFALTTAIRPI
ncbi:hypothetical protein MAR_036747 [Mya arenaria]|uniref:RING-type domain-containing protein n=1 Tax=Mya arenaria TaxID=6604 RepID=A0ABY7FQS4_MYAAR|nr:hypothetical protein MAR_036747 [Mya arenaria]